MTAAFFEFEEVLARPSREPIPLGITLLRLMRPGYRLILSTQETRPELIRWWVTEQGFPKGTFNYEYHQTPDEEGLDELDMFERHLEKALVHIPIELVVTANPSKAAIAMRRSITSLLFGSPATARPEFRPGRGVKAWGDIEAEVSRRRILKTKASAGESE
jgi:hypothetical protein